jgi:hypothetical protein
VTDAPPGDPPYDLPPGDPLYGSPTGPELLDAVGHFLRDELSGRLPPLEAFHSRVAANVVAMVARQLRAGDRPRSEVAGLLAEIGSSDEAGLAGAVRAGELDGRRPELRRVLRASVRARLEVANPAYLAANPEGPAD